MNYAQQLKRLNSYFSTADIPDEPGPINSKQVVRSVSDYVEISLIRINGSIPGSKEYNHLLRNLRYIAKNNKTSITVKNNKT